MSSQKDYSLQILKIEKVKLEEVLLLNSPCQNYFRSGEQHFRSLKSKALISGKLIFSKISFAIILTSAPLSTIAQAFTTLFNSIAAFSWQSNLSEAIKTSHSVTRDRDFSGCSGRGFRSLNN